MIHRLKILCLAAIAVLAMSAIVASASQAQFTASSYPKSATAESAFGNDTFINEGGNWACNMDFLVDALEFASTTLTVKPTITGCVAFGFVATVNTNGCHYVFHDTANNHANLFSISCPAGTSIQVIGGPCELSIPAQGPLSNVIVTTSGNHISVQLELTGIKFTVLKDGFLCPFNGTGAKTGASYVQHNPVTFTPIGGGSVSVD